ncbi:MAG: DUF2007 domain-containing protein [Clostridiales bacterium]|nr:DUF2007 domain-containing protein [Clostridiales bacterium]
MKEYTNIGNWVVIAECNTVTDASIIAGAIESVDIPVQIMNGTLQSALPMTYTWAPVQIMVPANLADEARKMVPEDSRF